MSFERGHMKKYVVALIGFVALGSIVAPRIALSQFDGNCPTLIQNALQRVEQVCTGTGRNQVCYANSWTEAEPQAFITDFSFELGDITDLMNIRSLRLGELDTTTDEWGMVLMRLQANVPASLPGQNVLFLLFGEVQLDDQDEMIDASPMQTIRLRTGVGGPGCTEAPPSGLLVQTPHGVGRVLLRINGVDVSLGSTVFFTAQANGFMTVSTIEGSALVHAEGGWSAALPGTQVRVPMTADLEPAGPPSLPEPYTLTDIITLPMSPLERDVEVLPPLDLPALQLLQQDILNGGLPEIGSFSALSLDLTQPSTEFISTPLLNTVNNIVNSTTGTALTTVSTVTTQTVDTAVNTVNSTLDTTQNLVNAVLPEQISQPVNQVVDTAQTVVTDVANTTTETVTTTVSDTTTTTVNTVTETVTNTVNEVADTTTETANQTVDTVVDQTQQTVNETSDTVENVVGSVQNVLPPLFGH
jgi:hypothetical protein